MNIFTILGLVIGGIIIVGALGVWTDILRKQIEELKLEILQLENKKKNLSEDKENYGQRNQHNS